MPKAGSLPRNIRPATWSGQDGPLLERNMKVAEETVGVTEFKPRSLELIENVASGKLGRVVLTKRGKPVAALVPLSRSGFASLHGALKHMMRPVQGADVTEPTGEVWEAERD